MESLLKAIAFDNSVISVAHDSLFVR